jgi:transcriptional regulator with XRE-family HTH domain
MQTTRLKPASTRKVRAAPTAAPRRDFDLPSLGGRIRAERERRGLSLDALSAKARVSRSMLSAIERGAKAPTVLVLDRVATGLNTSLARLLGEERRATLIVLRHRDQKVARDRSGWERRILSPVLPGVEFEFMRTTLGPRVNAGVFLPHAHGSREYVAIEWRFSGDRTSSRRRSRRLTGQSHPDTGDRRANALELASQTMR